MVTAFPPPPPAFEIAVEIVLEHEGGYVHDERDPGGETKFGISKRAYPDIEIKDLTRERAKQIYKRDYWDAIKGDSLPPWLALLVFDMAVNAGVSAAVKLLQSAVASTPDGVMGPHTIAMARDARVRVLRYYTERRIEYYAKLDGWRAFGKAWRSRAIKSHQCALSLFHRACMPVDWEII